MPVGPVFWLETSSVFFLSGSPFAYLHIDGADIQVGDVLKPSDGTLWYTSTFCSTNGCNMIVPGLTPGGG